jgi:hypothetical protein
VGGDSQSLPSHPFDKVPQREKYGAERIMASEKDPLGKSAHELGAKLDAGKVAVFRGLVDYFPRACFAVANVSTVGAQKYAWKGWERVPDGINRYGDALARHLLAESIEGPYDISAGGTGLLHAAQVAWNAMARLELMLRSMEKEVKAVERGG